MKDKAYTLKSKAYAVFLCSALSSCVFLLWMICSISLDGNLTIVTLGKLIGVAIVSCVYASAFFALPVFFAMRAQLTLFRCIMCACTAAGIATGHALWQDGEIALSVAQLFLLLSVCALPATLVMRRIVDKGRDQNHPPEKPENPGT